VDAETIALPRLDAGQIAVPAERRPFRKCNSCLTMGLVKQTEFDALGDLGENGEVGAASIPCRTERKWLAGAKEGAGVRGVGVR
jgi:hypothetical protein